MRTAFPAALPAAMSSVNRDDQPSPREVLAVRFHLASAALSALVFAAALIDLYGWWIDAALVRRLYPGFEAMTVNAAIGLMFTSAALFLYRGRRFSALRDTLVRLCSGVAAAIAAATVLERLTGWNLHIDGLLTPASASSAGTQMALATAVCLLLVNAAIVIAETPSRHAAAQVLVAVAIFFSTLNAVGYFFGVDAFNGLAAYSAMGAHTAVSILVVCLAFLFARPEIGLMDAVVDAGAGGLIVRQLLPVVFLLPLFLAWLSWQGVRAGWYEPEFAMTLFVALTINALSYTVWSGGQLVRAFDEKRRAAEAERARSEERLRLAVAGASVPMIIHDDLDAIYHMSRGWSEDSGYTMTDTPTVSEWIRCAQPFDEESVRGHFAMAAASGGTVHAGEWTIVAKTGPDRVWEVSTTPLGQLGQRHAFVTMAVDITDRKQAEAGLRRANEELEQRIAARTAEITRANDALRRQSDQLKEQAELLDIVRDGILVRDLYGTIVYWSAGATDLYGWSREQALGAVSHTLLGAVYPIPLADIERQVKDVGYWEGEVIHVTKSGTRLRVESHWTLTRTERGAPEGFLEVNRDATARRHAEEALRDSEMRFRAVAETAIEGILSIDETGTITYWNPGAERLFGRPVDQALGQPVSIVIPAPILARPEAAQAGAVVGTTFETAGRRADNVEFPLELSLATWTSAQGARYYTAVARDVTMRKATERALEAKAEELSRSNQELEQFAYAASHDLQEPLRMVANFTQLLGRRYKDKLDDDANEFIGFAVDGATRMQALIRDLLEYARVGTRGREFKRVPLTEVVSDAIQNLAAAVDESKAQIIVGELPAVACDAPQLTQVFQNLIGNAIKFRRPGTQPVITVSSARLPGAWSIAVRDNGIGIEPKYFDRIFQMFQRLHGRDEYAGTGIGLALCKKIVERHGGRIRVESETGRGTAFSFTIPDAPPGPRETTA